MRAQIFRGPVLVGSILSAALVFLVYLGLGATNVPLVDLLKELFRGNSHDGSVNNLILWELRMPRALACVFAGGVLSMVGSVFQALFRNPLAEPYIIGVSSGAAVGGTWAVVAGLDFGLARVGLATVGALLSLLFVVALARRQGAVNVQTLLVGGVVAGALLSGMTTLNLWLAGRDTNTILWWLLGSTTPMYWDRVTILAVMMILGGLVLFRQSRALNAFSVSEFIAERQGVDAKRLKWVVLIACTAMTGVAVGTVGVVGFVGLLAPHVARRLLGNDLRATLAVSALLGSTLLMCADILAQRIKPGTELPLGAVTAAIGAPALLWLLWKKG